MTEKRKMILKRLLQESRCRIRKLNRDFSLLLDSMCFVAVKDVYRTSTNGKCICFDADWLIKLDKTAIDFMLCHQLMHIALRHIYRPEFFQGEMFLIACDIVANSNLELLGWRYEKIKNVGKIYYETFFPAETGRNLTVKETLKKIPFDPASMDESKKRRYMIDSEKYWGKIIDPEKEGTFILGPDDRDIEDISDECKTGGEHLFLKKRIMMIIFAKKRTTIPKNTKEWFAKIYLMQLRI